jgi:hypothetical protein
MLEVQGTSQKTLVMCILNYSTHMPVQTKCLLMQVVTPSSGFELEIIVDLKANLEVMARQTYGGASGGLCVLAVA